MIQLFTGSTAANEDVMDKIWRFRHAQFVVRFGWEALRKHDGREIDQFDHEDALHLALFRADDVVGYSRLLPTTRPHLLSDIYPHIMQGRAWPRSSGIYEWTRCVTAEDNVLINKIRASHLLMTGVMEFCLAAGIESLIVETHPKLVDSLIFTGWQVNRLAPPSVIHDAPIVPIEAKPSIAGLQRHHCLYGIEGSVIQLQASQRNPVQPKAPLSCPSFPGFGPKSSEGKFEEYA